MAEGRAGRSLVWGLGGLFLALGIGAWIVWGPWNARGAELQVQAVVSRLLDAAPRQILNTAEGRYSFIYPYDFVSEKSRWAPVLSHLSEFLTRSAPLSPLEQEVVRYARVVQTYDLGRRPANQFLVFQVQAKAGLDLAKGALRWEKTSEGGQPVLKLSLPPVTLTELNYQEQASDEASPWPEYPLSPRAWRDLAEVLRPSVRDMILSQKILEEAQQNARGFFQGFLETAGVVNFRVEFRDQP